MDRMIGADPGARGETGPAPETGSTGQAGTGLHGPQAVLDLHGADPLQPLAELRARVDVLLERGPRTLVVDISEVPQLSSSMFAALVWVQRCASARGVAVVLREPDRRLVDTLQRSGLLSTAGRPTR